MTKQEKLAKLEVLRMQASELKRDVDYYNALQLALASPLTEFGEGNIN